MVADLKGQEGSFDSIWDIFPCVAIFVEDEPTWLDAS
jgi:hypothetical protein